MAMAGQVALRLPVVGWLLRDAIHGRPEAKYYFLANCLLAGALALLITMTAADSFSKANRRALAADKRRRPAL